MISLPGCQYSKCYLRCPKVSKIRHYASRTPPGNVLSSTAVFVDRVGDFRERLTALDSFTQESTRLRKHLSQRL